MDESKISTRYSKAFMEFAAEKNLLEEAAEDIHLILTICKMKDVMSMLESPVIQNSDKQKIIDSILKNKVNPITFSFIDLILKNNRAPYLKGICIKFIDEYKEKKGIKSAVLTSVKDINKTQKQKLIKAVEHIYKSKIELEEVIDENILGGFILTVEDQQFDASVASKLKKIRQELINVTFEN